MLGSVIVLSLPYIFVALYYAFTERTWVDQGDLCSR